MILLLLGEKAGMREVVKPITDLSRRLGARSLAMTEIRCRRMGTLFLYSFWDGRLGQLAFE